MMTGDTPISGNLDMSRDWGIIADKRYGHHMMLTVYIYVEIYPFMVVTIYYLSMMVTIVIYIMMYGD